MQPVLRAGLSMSAKSRFIGSSQFRHNWTLDWYGKDVESLDKGLNPALKGPLYKLQLETFKVMFT